jgi:predicted nucleotidyltransferase
MRTQPPAIAPFFRSQLQARLLAALLLSATEEVGVSELQDRLGASRSGIHQELGRLLDAGILTRRMVGRSALYRPAEDSPLVEPLRTLVERTVGVEPELRRALAAIDGVEAAAIYGSWAAGTSVRPLSDVDVLVIGDADADALERAIREVERRAGREVNLTRYDRDDWLERVRQGSGFARTVLDRPRIALVGEIPEDGRGKG